MRKRKGVAVLVAGGLAGLLLALLLLRRDGGAAPPSSRSPSASRAGAARPRVEAPQVPPVQGAACEPPAKAREDPPPVEEGAPNGREEKDAGIPVAVRVLELPERTPAGSLDVVLMWSLDGEDPWLTLEGKTGKDGRAAFRLAEGGAPDGRAGERILSIRNPFLVIVPAAGYRVLNPLMFPNGSARLLGSGPVDVLVERGGVIEGSVRMEEEEQIPEGVQVHCQGGGQFRQISLDRKAGRYRAVAFPPGECWLRCRGGGCEVISQPGGIAKGEIRAGEETEGPALVLRRGTRRLRGRAVASDGSALAGQDLRTVIANSGPEMDSAAVRTDAEGRFEVGIPYASPRKAIFHVRGTSVQLDGDRLAAALREGDAGDLAFALGGGRLFGRVLDHFTGAPIDGVGIQAAPAEGREGNVPAPRVAWTWGAVPDFAGPLQEGARGGWFALKEIPAGRWRLTVPGWELSAPVEAEAAEGQVSGPHVLRLLRAPGIRGKVVWAGSGEAASGARIQTEAIRDGLHTGTEIGAISDENGAFAIPALPPGRYSLLVTATRGGKTCVASLELEARPGVELPPVVLELSPS